ncbi:unnamed protein product [Lymnaea stagnalis]|uniref:DM14 domain-containing protein n=1 Tax=Lymnaea stagnalis TaxID=6523 RepID=A0AAV2GZ51_LYMST
MMSWPRGQEQRHQSMPVTTAMLEDRINQYITAVDQATARNDSHQVSQLQRDIQQLVDLMERIGRGQSFPENVVPPPLVIAPQIDVLPNPHVVLSARLDNYHKALYFAEEELSENKFNKIQQLQRCLQIVKDLQERVQAGMPVRGDEVPPPVPVPSDDEFDNDAMKTLTDRISSYKLALVAAQQSQESDKRHIPKIQSTLRSLEFLMTRAKANRPVWKKDIPADFEYHKMSPAKSSQSKMNKAKFTLLIRSLVLRTAKLSFRSPEMETKARGHHSKLVGIESQLSTSGAAWQPDEALLKVLTKQTEALEQKSMEEKQQDIQKTAESLFAIETRIAECENVVLNCEREDFANKAKQHLKSLLSLKEAVEKGELVNIELPPAFDLASQQQTVTPNDSISGTTAHQPTGATAHLSPVTIKPAVETPEDKLAKKLSHYLEKGDEPKLDNLNQRTGNVNLNTSQSPPPMLLPKVLNSARTEGTLVAPNLTTPHFSGDSGIHYNGFESSHQPAEDELGEEKNGTIGPSSSPVNTTVETSPQETPLEDERSYGQEIRNKKEEQETFKPLAPSPKSTDIYIRKTLDSVGFLPCQNVPERPLLNGKTCADVKLNSSAFSSESKSLHGLLKSDAPSTDLPGTDVVQDVPQQQFQSGAAETSSMDVPSNNPVDIEETVLRGVDGPSSLPVEKSASHFSGGSSSAAHLTSGQSSLPVSVQLNADTSQSHGQVLAAGTIQSTNTPSRGSPLAHDHSAYQEKGITNKESLSTNVPEEKCINSLEDLGVADMDISELNGHYLAPDIVNDSTEFQDLMESMTMPSLTSGSFQPETDQPIPILRSNVDPMMGSDKPVQQNVITGTQILDPRVKLSGDKFDSENDLILSDRSTVSEVAGRLTSQTTVVDTNPNLPIISNIQENHVTSVRPKDVDLTFSLRTESKHSGNVRHGGLPHSGNVRQGGFPKLEFPAVSVTQDTREQVRSEHLSGNQRSDDRLATTNGLQNDIAFTCLENLKYHFLIEEAKGTPASLSEASSLRDKFDQLKQRLSNGTLHLWEEYRACVESELASLVHQIEEKRLIQRWTEVKILCEMKTIAERELVILRERLPELMY